MQYEIIQLDARMPRYGACWKTALNHLDSGCRQLDDDVQSRLALSFANCFLEKAGMRTYPCQAALPLADCLRDVDNNAFTTYSNFFTHTQNMCYFLQSQVWQEETQETVNRLTATSAQVNWPYRTIWSTVESDTGTVRNVQIWQKIFGSATPGILPFYSSRYVKRCFSSSSLF